MINHIHLPFSA